MSVNRHLPHLMVLPEDRATAEIANGFVLQLSSSVLRSIQILPEVGGWRKVLDNFVADQIAPMKRYPNRLMVLLIDFDGDLQRIDRARETIPDDLEERVFILGALDEAESLKRDLGALESIGSKLARDCEAGTETYRMDPQLLHNAQEVRRLRERAFTILFPAS